jgi:hypothetical protein
MAAKPIPDGYTSISIYLAVDDAAQAIDFDDMFWGDRYGKLADPFGHEWQLATHTEDLTEEEIMERGKEAMASMS